jgi:hypothetical protein
MMVIKGNTPWIKAVLNNLGFERNNIIPAPVMEAETYRSSNGSWKTL